MVMPNLYGDILSDMCVGLTRRVSMSGIGFVWSLGYAVYVYDYVSTTCPTEADKTAQFH